ncbi:MAG: 6-phosphofructokinase [Dehalococcoidia bacterium]|nr:6-phosphofructokinase [Dehalococcoidia bacterium]
MEPQKTIGVLTGGGDCPGLNAAIRAVVRKGTALGYRVLGFRNGWAGVLNADYQELDANAVTGILSVGGTVLGTSRTNPLKSPQDKRRLLENFAVVDALVAIGGDDTLGVAGHLANMDLPVVGIPKTMDNDVAGTDYTIGFDSAVETVANCLDMLHTTAASHHRVMVVEVMGRDAGWVALIGGLTGGADYILIPEVPTDVQTVAAHLRERREARNKDSSIVVVSEGAEIEGLETREAIVGSGDQFGHARLDTRALGHTLGQALERLTGYETRATVLGHLQRGGSPTVYDRLMATRLVVAAVEYLHEGRTGVMAAVRGNQIAAVPLTEVIGENRKVDLDLYEMAKVFF